MNSKKPNTPKSKGTDKKTKAPSLTGKDKTQVPMRSNAEKGKKLTTAEQKAEKSKSKASHG